MNQQPVSEQMKEQVRRSILSYAIFRPESALVIALTMGMVALSLFNFPWFPGEWWMWVLFGVAGEGAIVLSTLRDTRFHRYVLDKMFYDQYDVKRLRNPELRQKLSKALEYRELLVREIERKDDPVLDDYLMDMTRKLEDWIAQVYQLAQRLDAYEQDAIIARDLEAVPRDLDKFKALLVREQEAVVRAELEKTISIKQTQWDTLRNLRDTMATARLQLENTLAAIGTVYMQVVLIGSKDVKSSRAQRLQADMAEQVRALQDTSAAMEEVYEYSARLAGQGGRASR